MTPRPALDPHAIPRLGAGVHLAYDKARKSWGLLAPERLFELNAQATEILKLVDGRRDLAAITDELAARFKAPRDRIAADVSAMLSGLIDKNVVHV